jgi:hypothetical protein
MTRWLARPSARPRPRAYRARTVPSAGVRALRAAAAHTRTVASAIVRAGARHGPCAPALRGERPRRRGSQGISFSWQAFHGGREITCARVQSLAVAVHRARRRSSQRAVHVWAVLRPVSGGDCGLERTVAFREERLLILRAPRSGAANGSSGYEGMRFEAFVSDGSSARTERSFVSRPGDETPDSHPSEANRLRTPGGTKGAHPSSAPFRTDSPSNASPSRDEQRKTSPTASFDHLIMTSNLVVQRESTIVPQIGIWWTIWLDGVSRDDETWRPHALNSSSRKRWGLTGAPGRARGSAASSGRVLCGQAGTHGVERSRVME